MAIVSNPRELLELHSGDRMSREELHRIYEQMPDEFRAELIGGIVYVASPTPEHSSFVQRLQARYQSNRTGG